jgi:hypothetical protein
MNNFKLSNYSGKIPTEFFNPIPRIWRYVVHFVYGRDNEVGRSWVEFST